MREQAKQMHNNSPIPVEIADSIIDSLSNEWFSDPKSKFCYASICDDYISDKLYDRLDNELKNVITDHDSRRDHIRNMIYGLSNKKLVTRILKSFSNSYNIINIKNFLRDDITSMPKFDYIIQNPPYDRTTHLKIFKKSLSLLKENYGKMTIIEPSSWLINVRKTSKLANEIKDLIKGHVYKVVLENFNKEFGTSIEMPLSITYLDFSNEYEDIEFICCGDRRIVHSLDDCNLIGNYKTLWSIFNKIISYKDMMKNHVCDKNDCEQSGTYYTKFAQLISSGHVDGEVGARGDGYKHDSTYIKVEGVGEYRVGNFDVCYHRKDNTIKQSFVNKEHHEWNLYGTKEELENWKHFIYTNKLPLFINLCVNYDKNNHSLKFIPWLVNKKYTDDEINTLFDFTSDEVAFIDKTLKKFERRSPWFERYMCGPSCCISDEVIQEFMRSL